MTEQLPKTNRCTKCDERFHTVHVCAADIAKALPPKPASPAEAEELAKKAVAEYLNACRMADAANLGNYLMKLVSVAGVLMANAEGSAEAALRLEGTAHFVLNTMPKKPATLRPVQ
jgi:hypothetical protein